MISGLALWFLETVHGRTVCSQQSLARECELSSGHADIDQLVRRPGPVDGVPVLPST